MRYRSMKKLFSLFIILMMVIFVSCKEKTKETEKEMIRPQEKYINEHPDLKEEVKQNILAELVEIGMTEEQVRASWGNPDHIEIFNSDYNSYKRWIYKDRPKVYMKDGKVDQLQK